VRVRRSQQHHVRYAGKCQVVGELTFTRDETIVLKPGDRLACAELHVAEPL
jgi:hypothetical protein